ESGTQAGAAGSPSTGGTGTCWSTEAATALYDQPPWSCRTTRSTRRPPVSQAPPPAAPRRAGSAADSWPLPSPPRRPQVSPRPVSGPRRMSTCASPFAARWTRSSPAAPYRPRCSWPRAQFTRSSSAVAGSRGAAGRGGAAVGDRLDRGGQGLGRAHPRRTGLAQESLQGERVLPGRWNVEQDLSQLAGPARQVDVVLESLLDQAAPGDLGRETVRVAEEGSDAARVGHQDGQSGAQGFQSDQPEALRLR